MRPPEILEAPAAPGYSHHRAPDPFAFLHGRIHGVFPANLAQLSDKSIYRTGRTKTAQFCRVSGHMGHHLLKDCNYYMAGVKVQVTSKELNIEISSCQFPLKSLSYDICPDYIGLRRLPR
jgi:hypothetical protein